MSALLRKADGSKVNIGDEVKTFRGEPVVVIGWRAGHPGSSGRVTIEFPGGATTEFYPSVIDCTIEEGAA